MKRIIYKIRLSLLFNIRKIKSYILKINRQSKRSKAKKSTTNKKDDDPYPVYIIHNTNCRAKFTHGISRGEFGSFCYAPKQDKLSVSIGCRGPPVLIFAFIRNQKLEESIMYNDKCPYTIRIEKENDVHHYYVSFVDCENVHRDIEVPVPFL